MLAFGWRTNSRMPLHLAYWTQQTASGSLTRSQGLSSCPAQIARSTCEHMSAIRTNAALFEIAVDTAQRLHISPICLVKQVEWYAQANALGTLSLDKPPLYQFVNRPPAAQPTVLKELFPLGSPSCRLAPSGT
jgi:hypothetical protein